MDERIVLAHGGGGSRTRELVEGLIVPALGGAGGPLPDAAPVPGAEGLVLTTDSFVVKPLFFHGGDIGSLSVHGTVNDLAVSGARPLALSMGLVIEEGLEIEVLRQVVQSAAEAAAACGIRIITGDTKVVARGEADQLFINTAGIGQAVLEDSLPGLQEGDHVVVNGPIGDHGVAVMCQREGIDFETSVRSDSAPVWPFVEALIQAGVPIHAMRDPTRGGIAATCVELSLDAGLATELEEAAIPVRAEVRAACEMLGLDVLTVANEGKLVVYVPGDASERAVEVIRGIPGGEHARAIGRVVAHGAVPVSLRTRFGGRRVVEMPYGEELPRIC